MFSESICPVRKRVEVILLDLENRAPVELCEGCTGGMVISFLQEFLTYPKTERGSEGYGPGSTFLPSQSSRVGFHTVK